MSNIKSDVEKLGEYFSLPPDAGQMAWGITHDVGNILLHYIQENQITISEEFDEMLDKLSPESTIQDVANLFYKLGLNPIWPVWWKE